MRRDHSKQRELTRHERWIVVWAALGLGILASTFWVGPDLPLPGTLLLLAIGVALNFAIWPHTKAARRLRKELRQ